MDPLVLALGWAGLYAPVALGAIGSILGCSRAGQAACGAMLEIEGGYGRYVGVSALPSSQTIYGIVVMFTLNAREVTAESAPGLLAIGVLSGVALMMSGIMQGACCASAINASKDKPEIAALHRQSGLDNGATTFEETGTILSFDCSGNTHGSRK